MAFIFLLFLFPDFIKADIINSNTFSEINKLDEVSKKKLSKSSFLKEIPRTKVTIKEKNSLSSRNPFLPFGQNNKDGKSGFQFSEIDLTGIAIFDGDKVAFLKTSEGTNPYQVGEIIGSGFKLIDINDENLTVKISNDLTTYSIKLEDDEK